MSSGNHEHRGWDVLPYASISMKGCELTPWVIRYDGRQDWFWSDEHGWDDFEKADRFTTPEKEHHKKLPPYGCWVRLNRKAR